MRSQVGVFGLLLTVACSSGGTGGAGGGSATGGSGGAGGSGGGTNNGSATVTGPIAFPVGTALSSLRFAPDGGGDIQVANVYLLHDVGVTCNNDATLTQLVVASVGVFDGGTVKAGTYPIGGNYLVPPGGAVVSYSPFGTDAGREISAYSSSGTVTFTQVGATVAGSFSVTMQPLDGGVSYSAGATFNAPNVLCP